MALTIIILRCACPITAGLDLNVTVDETTVIVSWRWPDGDDTMRITWRGERDDVERSENVTREDATGLRVLSRLVAGDLYTVCVAMVTAPDSQLDNETCRSVVTREYSDVGAIHAGFLFRSNLLLHSYT